MSAVLCDVAAPRFGLGQAVTYRDRHERLQSGAVKSVEAHWQWGNSRPLLIYTIEHPTYRNKEIHTREDNILYATERYNAR